MAKTNKELIDFLKAQRFLTPHRDLREKYDEFISQLEEQETSDTKPSIVPETWTITVPKGMTPLKAYKLCEKEFTCYTYDKDWLKNITEDRKTDKEYQISFKANVEADENLKNMSADNLKEKNIQGITLTERLLLELQYFKETGKHLDIYNITLCSGSRYSDDGVPGCDWRFGRFRVDWYGPILRYGRLRPREVVTLVTSSFIPSRDSKGRFKSSSESYVKGMYQFSSKGLSIISQPTSQDFQNLTEEIKKLTTKLEKVLK